MTHPSHGLRAKTREARRVVMAALAAILLTACVKPRTASVYATRENTAAEGDSLITYDESSLCAYNQTPAEYIQALEKRGWLLRRPSENLREQTSTDAIEPKNERRVLQSIPTDRMGSDPQLTVEQAQEIYKIVHQIKSPVDQVTGLANRSERIPTLVNIATRLGDDNSDLVAAYIEVDLRNLGGLNTAMGSDAAADVIFKKVVDLVHDSLQELRNKLSQEKTEDVKAELCAFRHGGDEFSFTLHAPASLVNAHSLALGSFSTVSDPRTELVALAEGALRSASVKIDDFAATENSKRSISDRGQSRVLKLNEIPHPKKCHGGSESWDEPLCKAYKGVGIYYGVAPVQQPAAAKDENSLINWLETCVINEADKKLLIAKEARIKSLVGESLSDDFLSEERPTRLAETRPEEPLCHVEQ